MSGMPAGEVLAVLDALTAAGYQRAWVAGGWGVGLPPFIYPPEGFARGVVAGRVVDCLSVGEQLRLHRGYPPRPQDLADIALLEHLARGSP